VQAELVFAQRFAVVGQIEQGGVLHVCWVLSQPMAEASTAIVDPAQVARFHDRLI
jgi:hypothetical protein